MAVTKALLARTEAKPGNDQDAKRRIDGVEVLAAMD